LALKPGPDLLQLATKASGLSRCEARRRIELAAL